MESLFRLGVVFRVIDKFSAPMRAFHGMVSAARDGLRELSRSSREWATRALVAGAAGAAMFALPAQAFGQFEAELAAVRAGTGATEQQMKRLEDTAIRLGIETEHSPLAAIKGFRELTEQGFTLDQAFQAIRPTLALATAGQLDVGTAAATAAATINSFNLTAEDSRRVVDVLMKATTLSALKAGEYQMAVGKMGAASVAANQDFEQMIGLLGILRSRGLTAENSAEKIKQALIALQTPSEDAQKLIGKLGIELRDTGGRLKPWPDMVDEIQKAIGGLTPEIRDMVTETLFGREGMDAFKISAQAAFTDNAGIVHQGTDAIRAMTSELKNSEGAAQAFADAFLATWPGKLKLLSGSWETLNTVMGKHVAEVLKPFIVAGTEALNQVIAWAQANPEAARSLVRLGLALTAVVIGAGLLFLAIWGITAALGVLMTAFLVLTSPAAIVIGIILAVGAAVYLVMKNWDRLGDFFSDLWGSIKATFAGGLAWILEKMQGLPSWAKKPLGIGQTENKWLLETVAELRTASNFTPSRPLLPSFAEAKADFGLGKLEAPTLPGGVTSFIESIKKDVSTVRSAPPVFNIQNLNLEGVTSPEELVEKLRQASGHMTMAEQP